MRAMRRRFQLPFPLDPGLAAWGRDKKRRRGCGSAIPGANLARIDTNTQELSFVPLPGAQHPITRWVDA